MEPELITIIEGPTPDFVPNYQGLVQSVYEGPADMDVALCQLRTGNGEDIRDRCLRAWQEGRPVRLDYPDDLRLRQQVDVVALRLTEVDEGELLLLWVSLPGQMEDVGEDESDDDFDSDIPF
ncbi:MAG: hypothetical protein LC131_10920 [Anaerolineae bacterium]|nr:hypothetical protein [Promineifilum sp.]MCZ2114324.1 hypothetical protein [Anaerolineae bacterium]HNS39328.1 hypothetical protein [Promineifilum sp.]